LSFVFRQTANNYMQVFCF